MSGGTSKSSERAARQARLAKALRDNLKKRKAQARGRGGAAPVPEAPPGRGEATARQEPAAGDDGEA